MVNAASIALNATGFDRIQLREDVTMGQRIRAYTVEMQYPGSSSWIVLARGQAIGTKRILLLDKVVPLDMYRPTALRLNIQEAVAPPVIRQFAVFAPCRTG